MWRIRKWQRQTDGRTDRRQREVARVCQTPDVRLIGWQETQIDAQKDWISFRNNMAKFWGKILLQNNSINFEVLSNISATKKTFRHVWKNSYISQSKMFLFFNTVVKGILRNFQIKKGFFCWISFCIQFLLFFLIVIATIANYRSEQLMNGCNNLDLQCSCHNWTVKCWKNVASLSMLLLTLYSPSLVIWMLFLYCVWRDHSDSKGAWLSSFLSSYFFCLIDKFYDIVIWRCRRKLTSR
jgi:hypothetical protein